MSFPPINGYYLTLGLLVGCTLMGILVAARFSREVEEDLAPPTRQDLLGPLERAYDSGLMHPAEIERIRESIKKQQAGPVIPPRWTTRPYTQAPGPLVSPERPEPEGD